MKHVRLLGILFALCFSTDSFSQDYEKVKISPELEAVFANNPILMEGDVCRVVETSDSILVLASAYGIAEAGTGFKGKKESARVATITADRLILEYLVGATISGSDFIWEKEESKDDITSFSSFFESKTRSELERTLLSGVIDGGSWEMTYEGERVFFRARYLPIKKSELNNTSSSSTSSSHESPIESPSKATQVCPCCNRKLLETITNSGPSDDCKESQGDNIVVIVIGESGYLGNAEFSRTEALNYAEQEAIRQAFGQLIEGDTLIINGEVKLDRLYSAVPPGTVTHRILEEGVDPKDDEIYFVKICATVSKKDVEMTAENIGLLKSQLGDPKITIIPFETLNGERLIYASSPTTTALMGIFAMPPYYLRPIDMQQSMVTKRTQQPKIWEKYQKMMEDGADEFDVIKFGELGMSADILVKGEVVMRDQGKTSDGVFTKYTILATVKIIFAGTGEFLGEVIKEVSVVAETPDQAIAKAVQKITPKLEVLVEKMMTQWQDIARNGQLILLAVDGIPKGRKGRKLLKTIQEGLKDVPKVKQVEKNSTQDDYANFTVRFLGTPSTFEELFIEWLDEEIGDWLDENDVDFDVSVRGGALYVSFRPA